MTPDVTQALVDNHRRFLAFLERRVGRRDVAEEILQDAFVRGLAKADSLHEGEASIAWFYRVLRNALVDHYRREGARTRALDAASREPSSADDAELEREVCACVTRLIDTLKPEHADALRAVELGGQSVQDFARSLDITANNAGVRLHRAREALRKQVMRSCGSCAEHGCLDCECHTGEHHAACDVSAR